jgi:predicted transcriptional regulator
MSEIEAFLLHHSMSAREFGRRAMGDPSFVYECRGGRSPGLDTVAVVMRFMERYKPKQRPAA